jgi:hypothetical protein
MSFKMVSPPAASMMARGMPAPPATRGEAAEPQPSLLTTQKLTRMPNVGRRGNAAVGD